MMLATLVIATVLITLSIKVTSTSMQKRANTRKRLKARFAAESGISYAQARLHHAQQMGDLRVLNGVSKKMDSNTYFELEVELDRGFFNVTSIGHHLEKKHRVQALLGNRAPDLTQKAFVLEKSSHELYASGSTHIEGDAVLPQGMVISRSLHGEPAAKKPVVSGKIAASEQLRKPDWNLFYEQEMHAFLKQAHQIQYGINKLPKGKPMKNNPQSRILELKGRTIRCQVPLKIPGELKEIRGPGVILCKGSLEWTQQVDLIKNVWLVLDGDIHIQTEMAFQANLLATGNIKVSGKLQGSGSIFSLSAIELSGGTKLTLPTTIGLIYNSELSPKTPKQLILGKAEILGTVFAFKKTTQQWLPWIQVEPECQFTGYLITNGQTQLKSAMKGFVYTGELVSRAGAQQFLNWMKSIDIKRQQDRIQWALPPGMGEEVEVLTWLQR